ncbi:hypothetical protein WA158_005558 [Blastocystis sp. Blastoise]
MQSEKTVQVKNVRIVNNHEIKSGELWYKNGLLLDAAACKYITPDEVIDGNNCLVCPGFIDIQINGAYGYDFSDPSITKEEIDSVTKRLANNGCVAICPTIITSSPEVYKKILPLYTPRKGGVEKGAATLGVHCEGPFIAPQRRGAHPLDCVKSPVEGGKSVMDMYGSLENIKIVTIAAENPGAPEAIKFMVEHGLTVSEGHTVATIEQAEVGIHSGATLLTHLFNAMNPFHHRDPGVIGLLGMDEEKCPHYSIISDGIHSHPYAVRFAHKAHPTGAILITDAMAAMGLPAGHYKLGKQNVVIENNKAVLEENENTLAGSIVSIDTCVRNFTKFTGCSQIEAIEAATLRPAQIIHIDNKKGSLNPGMDADFLFLDDNLNVMTTFIGGEKVFEDKELLAKYSH